MAQYVPLGTEATPAAWVLPPSLRLQLEVIFAHFDGTNAAGAFLPTVQIVSDSGHTVAEIPMDASVGAGSSVEATWAPFLKGAAAAAATSAGVAWAWMSGTNGAFPNTGFAAQTVDLASGSLATTDATMFAVGVSGGNHGISILKAGSYLLSVTVNGNTGVAPAAGAFIQTAQSAAISDVVNEMFEGPWLADGAGSWSAQATQQTIIEVRSPGAPPPQLIQMDAGQNSGAAIFLAYYMGVLALSTVTP